MYYTLHIANEQIYKLEQTTTIATTKQRDMLKLVKKWICYYRQFQWRETSGILCCCCCCSFYFCVFAHVMFLGILPNPVVISAITAVVMMVLLLLPPMPTTNSVHSK